MTAADLNELTAGVNRLLGSRDGKKTDAPVNFSVGNIQIDTRQVASSEKLAGVLQEKLASAPDLQSWVMFADEIRTGVALKTLGDKATAAKVLEAEFYSESLKISARVKRAAGDLILVTFYIIDGAAGEDLPRNTISLRVRQDIAARKNENSVPGNAVYTIWYRPGKLGRITPFVQQFAGFSTEAING
ncbi:hypothetical protein [Succinimonas sp.]|uniref:hypothetical protein n=1 Tax=Succinimonas sp. TaxID=1936151 RepID=UPI00386E6085